uniref:Uncharacterized protein n=1 Tax=Chromera velia CCMP2878 TaxID=1169474 RepID=A0A0G4HCL3_9ALVE|eukprot:Cvel_6348.t1-p1 / transcript=Cvel_6348.t1 / gene=Cvel_6348 / organism=Chromera_velia_CCMP2878 / gene_product=hypothetical protein / transcript_product=hypothetical protein / location=Cvel_scaffold308:84965-91976(-) / protein_length=1298 / sequence_SO=supercontig / SO=protein_coding / is_pseudo=false
MNFRSRSRNRSFRERERTQKKLHEQFQRRLQDDAREEVYGALQAFERREKLDIDDHLPEIKAPKDSVAPDPLSTYAHAPTLLSKHATRLAEKNRGAPDLSFPGKPDTLTPQDFRNQMELMGNSRFGLAQTCEGFTDSDVADEKRSEAPPEEDTRARSGLREYDVNQTAKPARPPSPFTFYDYAAPHQRVSGRATCFNPFGDNEVNDDGILFAYSRARNSGFLEQPDDDLKKNYRHICLRGNADCTPFFLHKGTEKIRPATAGGVASRSPTARRSFDDSTGAVSRSLSAAARRPTTTGGSAYRPPIGYGPSLLEPIFMQPSRRPGSRASTEDPHAPFPKFHKGTPIPKPVPPFDPVNLPMSASASRILSLATAALEGGTHKGTNAQGESRGEDGTLKVLQGTEERDAIGLRTSTPPPVRTGSAFVSSVADLVHTQSKGMITRPVTARFNGARAVHALLRASHDTGSSRGFGLWPDRPESRGGTACGDSTRPVTRMSGLSGWPSRPGTATTVGGAHAGFVMNAASQQVMGSNGVGPFRGSQDFWESCGATQTVPYWTHSHRRETPPWTPATVRSNRAHDLATTWRASKPWVEENAFHYNHVRLLVFQQEEEQRKNYANKCQERTAVDEIRLLRGEIDNRLAYTNEGFPPHPTTSPRLQDKLFKAPLPHHPPIRNVLSDIAPPRVPVAEFDKTGDIAPVYGMLSPLHLIPKQGTGFACPDQTVRETIRDRTLRRIFRTTTENSNSPSTQNQNHRSPAQPAYQSHSPIQKKGPRGHPRGSLASAGADMGASSDGKPGGQTTAEKMKALSRPPSRRGSFILQRGATSAPPLPKPNAPKHGTSFAYLHRTPSPASAAPPRRYPVTNASDPLNPRPSPRNLEENTPAQAKQQDTIWHRVRPVDLGVQKNKQVSIPPSASRIATPILVKKLRASQMTSRHTQQPTVGPSASVVSGSPSAPNWQALRRAETTNILERIVNRSGSRILSPDGEEGDDWDATAQVLRKAKSLPELGGEIAFNADRKGPSVFTIAKAVRPFRGLTGDLQTRPVGLTSPFLSPPPPRKGHIRQSGLDPFGSPQPGGFESFHKWRLSQAPSRLSPSLQGLHLHKGDVSVIREGIVPDPSLCRPSDDLMHQDSEEGERGLLEQGERSLLLSAVCNEVMGKREAEIAAKDMRLSKAPLHPLLLRHLNPHRIDTLIPAEIFSPPAQRTRALATPPPATQTASSRGRLSDGRKSRPLSSQPRSRPGTASNSLRSLHGPKGTPGGASLIVPSGSSSVLPPVSFESSMKRTNKSKRLEDIWRTLQGPR